MPFYDYKCKKCEEIKEYFLTMTEHAQDPPKECEKCGGEVYQEFDPKSPMKFYIPGEGAFYNNRLQ